MDWLTIVWSMTASACLTLAFVHLIIWIKQRSNIAHLLFSTAAISLAGIAAGELSMMRAQTANQFAVAMRWTHIPVFVSIVSLVGFIRVYFRSGRRWLAWTICALRLLALIVNFCVWPNLHYKEIPGLKQIDFAGETISIAVGDIRPWGRLAQFSSLLFLFFVADASISLWRRGSVAGRRRALAVGGSLTLFVFVAVCHSILVQQRILSSPYLISLPFAVPLLVMAYELGTEVVRAARLSDRLRISRSELHQSRQRFRMVVEAAPNAMIMVGADGKILLVNAQAERIFGYSRHELLNQPMEVLLPEQFSQPAAVTEIEETPRELFGRRRDGSQVAIEIGLSPIQTAEGLFVLASIIDISERRRAEHDASRQRNELAHLSRVTMLGELSGSLAHELNQPLTAILSNAQAAQRFLELDASDIREVKEVLQDIIDADRRAGEIIYRLRQLFKKGEVQYQPVDLNVLIDEVLKFMNSDLINHHVTVHKKLEPAPLIVQTDRVQIQQVLINLITNGSDSMASIEPGDRQLRVSSQRSNGSGVEIAIADNGCGIPSADLESIFEPFVTTKGHGMGLGLAVSRTIVTAHGGRLWATNNPARGATLHLTLPTA